MIVVVERDLPLVQDPRLTTRYRSRNRSALNAKLKGTTLADASADDGLSAKDWLKRQKKRAKQREKELAERKARELEEDKAVYDERECHFTHQLLPRPIDS